MFHHDDEVARVMTYYRTHPIRPTSWRFAYHVQPPTGWMNDPNGFTYYKGYYHLFFQHHPFTPEWGPMYWGHARSLNLIEWEYVAPALAPTDDYDLDGCFSGSAIEVDEKLWLMYTGNTWTGANRDTDLHQVQCLAVSEDGLHFEKYSGNPVIAQAPGAPIHPHHFRDPKVFRRDDRYYCVLGSRTNDERGQVLLYRSSTLTEWEFVNVVAGEMDNGGYMWECPDLIELDGEHVLLFSPQGVQPEGERYHNLHQACYVQGEMNWQTGQLTHGHMQLLDYGFDFYAPQTLQHNGETTMIGWMAMWEADMPEKAEGWAGAMTIPRQLTMEAGQLKIRPHHHLMFLRKNYVYYRDVSFQGQLTLPALAGNVIELQMDVALEQATTFTLKVRVGHEQYTAITVTRDGVTLDRTHSGQAVTGQRRYSFPTLREEITLHLFLDYSSLELFINDGEATMTARIYPDVSSTGVQFEADGLLLLQRVKKWNLQ